MIRIVEHHAFVYFKYAMYLLLALNIFLFLWEEMGAAAQVLSADLALPDVMGAFSATVDTAAWVGLLLLFELETWQIPPERLTPRLRLLLHGARGFFYLFVLYAFFGYVIQAYQMHQVTALDVPDACAVVGENKTSFQTRLDEFVPIESATCSQLPATGGIYSLDAYGTAVVTNGETLESARRLAWTDVINAATWILVVILLELDVRLKQHGELRGYTRTLLGGATMGVYVVLLACALHWLIAGTFLDFWDALLWLVAFAFIELNVFGKAQPQPV